MPTRPPRPCTQPGCGNLVPPGQTRCPTHAKPRRRLASATQRGYDSAWARHATAAIARHRAEHGDTCPGFRHPAHPIHPKSWVCDHDLGPLCRSCNARKAATVDRARAQARRRQT